VSARADSSKDNPERKAATHTHLDGRLVPYVDTDGAKLVMYPWKPHQYRTWKIVRETLGLKQTSIEMYLDSQGYCTTCKGRGQVTEHPRPVFGEDAVPRVYYRPCPAKCRKGRVRNAWEPWWDPEREQLVTPPRRSPPGSAYKNIGDHEEMPPDVEATLREQDELGDGLPEPGAN
jgi:hypothetical protein